jgi:hypothetical protein
MAIEVRFEHRFGVAGVCIALSYTHQYQRIHLSGLIMNETLFPCGQTRRQALWQMGGGFAGLALASLLERDGFFAKHAAVVSPTYPAPITAISFTSTL